MGKTVIEELVISLGLDAKALEDSKAMSAIDSIRDSVRGLNDELKGVEKTFKEMWSAGGRVKLGATATKERKQKKPATTEDWIASFVTNLALPGKKKTDPVPVKAVETPSKKRSEQDKTPTSMKSMLTGIGGTLGSLAAGMYLFKSVADGIGQVYTAMTQFLGMGQQAKNTAEAIGLTAEQLSTFGSIAMSIGKNSDEVISDIDRLGKEYTSEMPGYFMQGIQGMMGITGRLATGERKPFQQYLDEVFNYAANMKGDEAYKKSILRDAAHFSEGTASVAMLGAEQIKTRHKGLVQEGYAPGEELIQKEAALKIKNDMASAKIKIALRKMAAGISDELVNAFSFATGTSGVSEASKLYQKLGKDDFLKALSNTNLSDSERRGITDALGITTSTPSVSFASRPPSFGMGTPENMTINLSVDKDKAKVDANINGKPMSNVRVNLAPNHTGQ